MSYLPKFKIYNDAYSIALEIYSVTRGFPIAEQFGITSQLRRAGHSIPSNIAEGYRKRTAKEKIHFYTIAICSIEECIFFLSLSIDLGYIIQTTLLEKLDSLAKSIHAYCKAIRINPRNT